MVGILWDLDGTLLDTLDDLTAGVNHAMDAFGYPRRTREDVRRFVGNGARKLMERAAPEGADVGAVLEAFHDYYDIHCEDKTAPYPGIPETLAELRDYPMAIVSNKPDVAVKPLCERYFPGLYARGEAAGCPRKPAPDMVFAAMRAIGVTQCVYVGDSEVDVQTARNAGMPCLSVLWGFRDRPEIEDAGGQYFCSDPRELKKELESLMEMMAGESYGQ